MNLVQRLILLTIFTISMLQVNAQQYIKIGYDAVFPSKFKDFDNIINTFNYSHQNTTSNMEYIDFLQGFTIGTGRYFEIGFVETAYSGAWQKTSGKYVTNSGSTVKQELKVGIHTIDISAGIHGEINDWNYLAFGCGISLGKFSTRVRTSTDNNNNYQWSHNLIHNGSNIFSYNFFVRYYILYNLICFEPYISLTPSKVFGQDMFADLSSVDANLNPGNYQGTPPELKAITKRTGVKIIINIPLKGFK